MDWSRAPDCHIWGNHYCLQSAEQYKSYKLYKAKINSVRQNVNNAALLDQENIIVHK